MTKKKKIILISVSVTLALVMGVGGLAYAVTHPDVGGNKLLGVGEMGFYEREVVWGQVEWWDTQFIITNPNCEKYLDIKWVALIAGDDACEWYAEHVIFEGTPEDWYAECGIEIPGNELSHRGVLSPHEVWQVSIAELIGCTVGADPEDVVDGCDLGKYTLEVTWSGVSYSWWGGWRRGRPLTGWQKEKCMYLSFPDGPWDPNQGFAISEAEMKLFPSRMRFHFPY